MTSLENATRELNVSRSLNLVAFAILYYDYGLTVSLEYERYWFTGSFTWAAFLFFVVRYLAVFGHIPVILHIFANKEGPLCSAMLLFHQIFAIVIQVCVGALLIIRTYALYNRDRWVLASMVGIAVSGSGVACWAVLTPHGPPPPLPEGVGCNINLSNLQGIYFAIAWGSMLFFDTLVFGLTVARGIAISRRGRRTLFDIMLRDGSVYFACMSGANLANIITFIVCPPSLKGVPTILTNVISTTLISRLMLNVRDPKILNRSRSLTTTTTNSAGPLTRTDNLPFYSTLYPATGDLSVTQTPVAEYESTTDMASGSEYYELGPLRKSGEL